MSWCELTRLFGKIRTESLRMWGEVPEILLHSGLCRSAFALLGVLVSAGCTVEMGNLEDTRFQCDTDTDCPGQQECLVNKVCGEASQPGSYAREVLADEPVLYWSFDQFVDGIVEDLSGNARHGQVEGGVELGPGAFPSSDRAAYFDGKSGMIVVAHDEVLWFNESFTFEMWVKLSEPANEFPGVLGKGGTGGTANGYHLYYNASNDSPELSLKRSALPYVETSGGGLSRDEFRHYAFSYDHLGNVGRWYVDGEENRLFADLARSLSDDPSPVQAGRGGQGQFGNHGMDHLALYDRALSSDRIAQHYAVAQQPIATGE